MLGHIIRRIGFQAGRFHLRLEDEADDQGDDAGGEDCNPQSLPIRPCFVVGVIVAAVGSLHQHFFTHGQKIGKTTSPIIHLEVVLKAFFQPSLVIPYKDRSSLTAIGNL